MITTDYIIITFKNVEYKISIQKLEYVFSKLENKKIIIKNDKQVGELLAKYKLYDEIFFESVNSI